MTLELGFLLLALGAGFLTVLSPCILPLLPVVVGGSVDGEQDSSTLKPLLVTGGLGISAFVFTLLVRSSLAAFPLTIDHLRLISAVILIIFGLAFLWPEAWERLTRRLSISANKALGKANHRESKSGAFLMGVALGPVFTSCSPTYGVILAVILPQNLGLGVVYLTVYVLGLVATLFLVAYGGQALIKKLGWLADNRGWFKRTMGLVIIIVGVGVIFGFDKTIQSFLLDRGWLDATQFETRILQ